MKKFILQLRISWFMWRLRIKAIKYAHLPAPAKLAMLSVDAITMVKEFDNGK